VSCNRLIIKTFFRARELNLILMPILIFTAIMLTTFSKKLIKERIKDHLRTSMRSHLPSKESKRFLPQTKKIIFLCPTLTTI
jgi:hypothetical protein